MTDLKNSLILSIITPFLYNLYRRNQIPLLRYVFAAFGVGKPRSIRGIVVGDFLVYLFCLIETKSPICTCDFS